MTNASRLSRRHFLAACSGLVAAAGCAGGQAPQAEAPADPCMDVRGLSQAETATRTAVNYIAETPFSDQRCDNCQFWLPPAEGASCGGCVIVKGPIHPAGHCTSWAPPPGS